MVSAFLIPARRPSISVGMVPSAWVTSAVAFLLGISVLYMQPKWGWSAVGALLAVDAAFLALVAFFSRRAGWNALHTLGLAAGGATAYGVHASTQKPLVGGLLWMRIGNAVFLAAAVLLISLCARRVIRSQTLA